MAVNIQVRTKPFATTVTQYKVNGVNVSPVISVFKANIVTLKVPAVYLSTPLPGLKASVSMVKLESIRVSPTLSVVKSAVTTQVKPPMNISFTPLKASANIRRTYISTVDNARLTIKVTASSYRPPRATAKLLISAAATSYKKEPATIKIRAAAFEAAEDAKVSARLLIKSSSSGGTHNTSGLKVKALATGYLVTPAQSAGRIVLRSFSTVTSNIVYAKVAGNIKVASSSTVQVQKNSRLVARVSSTSYIWQPPASTVSRIKIRASTNGVGSTPNAVAHGRVVVSIEARSQVAASGRARLSVKVNSSASLRETAKIIARLVMRSSSTIQPVILPISSTHCNLNIRASSFVPGADDTISTSFLVFNIATGAATRLDLTGKVYGRFLLSGGKIFKIEYGTQVNSRLVTNSFTSGVYARKKLANIYTHFTLAQPANTKSICICDGVERVYETRDVVSHGRFVTRSNTGYAVIGYSHNVGVEFSSNGKTCINAIVTSGYVQDRGV